MPDEYEIQAVMVNTDCDRETAVKALERSNGRVSFAIRCVPIMENSSIELCPFCDEPVDDKWKYCPYCGTEMDRGA